MSDKEVANSLLDLCERLGFAAVDEEVARWIEIGEFDEQVAERAEKLGWYKPGTRWADIETEPLF